MTTDPHAGEPAPLGFEVEDEVTGKHLIVLRETGERADEAVVTYDFDMNEITVADKNEEHGCSPDEPVVEVAYVETLDRKFTDTDIDTLGGHIDTWRDLSFDDLKQTIEATNVKAYSFPKSRVLSRVDGGYTGK